MEDDEVAGAGVVCGGSVVLVDVGVPVEQAVSCAVAQRAASRDAKRLERVSFIQTNPLLFLKIHA